MAGSIVESVVEYFTACPLLKDGVFRVDALGDEATEYTIGIGSFDPIIERYIDGSSDRRFQLTFESREFYSQDRIQNLENSGFYEKLSDWIDEQAAQKHFPDLPEKCYPETLRALSSGYLFDENGETARYQIVIELTYHRS